MHHIIANAQPVGGAPNNERTPGRVGLGGITPNMPGVTYDPGIARLLPANSEIILQMHYTTNGAPTTDRTSVGVIYAKEPPKKALGGGMILNAGFAIPPGADNHEVKGTPDARAGHGADAPDAAHAHARQGHDLRRAPIPTGASETLLSVPKYRSTGRSSTSWRSRRCCRKARAST